MTDEDLAELFVMTHRMMHRHYFRNALGEGGINPRQGQGRILALLKSESGMSQKELAQRLNMRQQSMGEFLVKLEKNGYLTRRPSEEDRRTMIIELTEKGRTFHIEPERPERLYGGPEAELVKKMKDGCLQTDPSFKEETQRGGSI